MNYGAGVVLLRTT